MLKPDSVRTCVLYDPKDGTIVHMHKEITMAGGQQRTDAEIEERVRRFASKPDRNVANLKAAFVKDTRRKGPHYRIDTSTLAFVEIKR